MMSIEVIRWKKLHDKAQEPTKGTPFAGGYDLTATDVDFDENLGVVTYHTGVAMEIPHGCAGFLFPRSSVYKTGLIHADCVGVVDSDYRGEILFRYYDVNSGDLYAVGDRVGQIVIMPVFNNFLWFRADNLTDTERGNGGFGSTGR